MKKLLLLTVALLFAVVFTTQAQDRSVSGTVTSIDDGSGIPGVNVILKGTTIGTVTDVEGRYRMSVPQDGGTLVFTFIGLATQEVEIGSRSVIDVQMSADVQQLSEVVVLGYSSQSKEKIISSVATVNAEAIENVVLPDVTQILQGQAPGVMVTSPSGQPGAFSDIRIRGTGSIDAGRGPLFVIDGVIVENGDFTQTTETNDVMSNINPNDIESISVLKDATATSLYGSRGSNGVILINTKSGKAGKTQITVRSQYGVVRRNDGEFDMMNSDQVVDYERDLLAAAGLSQAVIDANRPLSLKDTDTDWIDLAFDEGHNQKYEISAQGGNDKTTFFLSGEYFDQDGNLIESEFKRYSMRANIKHQATEKIDLALNFNPSYTEQLNATAGNRFSSPLLGAFVNTPFQSHIDPNTGELYRGDEPGFGIFTSDNFLYSVPRNPVINNNLRMLGNFTAGYNIFENLRIQTKVGLDFISIKESRFFDPTTGDGIAENGEVQRSYNENINYTTQTMLSGNKTINDVHNFDGIAVFEYQKNQFEEFFAAGIGLASGKLKTLQSTATPDGADGSKSEYSFLSYLGQLNYNYNNKYYFTSSIRRDGSSRFGINNRWANFWSVGGSWRISEEDFMSGIGVISSAKLRVSYGTSGNADIGNFQSQALFGFAGAYNGIPSSNATQIANPDLTWETTKVFNIGLDFGVFSDRITGSVEYYNRRAEDMLQEVPVSSTSGFETAIRNIGEMENKGVEVVISSQNLVGAVKWSTNFNIAFNNNKVLKLNDGEDIPNGRQIIREGLPIRSWEQRRWAGVNPADGTPLWFNEDGSTTGSYNAAPEIVFGNAEPDFTSGMTNTWEFKGISLSAFFYAAYGHEIFNSSRRFIESDGQRYGWNHLAVAADRWMQPGDIAERPQAILGGNNQANSSSDRYIEDGSYLRLRNVTLGYNLPSSILGNSGLTRVRVYIQGQNLWTLTDYSGFDPELDENGSEFFRYPQGRSYTFGIEIGL